MSTQLSAKDMFDISRSFHSLSQAVGDFRYAHWHDLSVLQRQDLEAKQWTLLNMSSDLNAASVALTVELLSSDLKKIQSCTVGMRAVAQKIVGVKHAIGIATKAVAFGGAIYLAVSTGDITAMIAAASSLDAEING